METEDKAKIDLNGALESLLYKTGDLAEDIKVKEIPTHYSSVDIEDPYESSSIIYCFLSNGEGLSFGVDLRKGNAVSTIVKVGKNEEGRAYVSDIRKRDSTPEDIEISDLLKKTPCKLLIRPIFNEKIILESKISGIYDEHPNIDVQDVNASISQDHKITYLSCKYIINGEEQIVRFKENDNSGVYKNNLFYQALIRYLGIGNIISKQAI